MTNNIKKFREKLNLTQLEASKKSEVSLRAFQNYELGIRVPNATTSIKIAHSLGTTVEKLFTQ